jgi:Asp-tRNA(Asn)/Glu-tRNA(Gln) amidotransferase C subunit
LRKDPRKRPSATKLLQHKFVKHSKRTAFLTELIDFKEQVFQVPPLYNEPTLKPAQSKPQLRIESKYNRLNIEQSAAKEIQSDARSFASSSGQEYESELNEADFAVEEEATFPNK